MKKEKLIITVSGRTMSGKSCLSFLLKKFLQEKGFDVKHEVTLDYHDENHFEKQMSKNFDNIVGIIKEQREIIIKEEQLRRDYFELMKEQPKIDVSKRIICLETIIRRTISSILFVVLLFSPITIIEIILYTIRFIIKGESFPKNPYSWQFIYRMW